MIGSILSHRYNLHNFSVEPAYEERELAEGFSMLVIAADDGFWMVDGERFDLEPGHRALMVRVQGPDGEVETGSVLLEDGEDLEGVARYTYWVLVDIMSYVVENA